MPHSEILTAIFEQIQQVNFDEYSNPKASLLRKDLEKLDPESTEAKLIRKKMRGTKAKDYQRQFTVVAEVLRIARDKNWNICCWQGRYFLYNGAFWTQIEKKQLQNFLGRAAEKMGIVNSKARYHRFEDDLIKQVTTFAYFTPKNVGADRVVINLLNGTFEINADSIGLREFDPDDFLAYQLNFSFDEAAKASMFQKYLNAALPDKNSQLILAEYLGYLFVKHESKRMKLEKALILFGSGANGKSVFFEIVSALLGEHNVCHYSLEELTNPSSGYQRAMIGNKLVNYASEISTTMNSAIFKLIVSGEPLSARPPYGEPVILTDYAKLIFNCNSLPKNIENSDAFFRRLIIIPFDVTIPEDQQDKQLATKIISNELPGVFNWVLEGLNRLLMNRKFTESQSSAATLLDYRLESDSVAAFILHFGYKVTPNSNNYVLSKILFEEYRLYCIEEDRTILSNQQFAESLRRLKVPRERKNKGYVYFLAKASE